MIQMVTRARKPVGRPKQSRPTAKLNNTTIRDFGGGLNVVDSEQNLTSKFSPVFDNMITYTDRRVGPRNGYEMWLKLKQGTETINNAGTNITITTTAENKDVTVHWVGHPIQASTDLQHIAIGGWGITFNGVTPEMMNRTHGVYQRIDADNFRIVLSNRAVGSGTSPVESINWKYDTHMLGGEPVECTYFSNVLVVWTSNGEIFTVDRDKVVQRIWSAAHAYALPMIGEPAQHQPPWTYTDTVAFDIFGRELVCSNGRDKPLTIDFTRDGSAAGEICQYMFDGGATPATNAFLPAFNACKSAFRYFTVHDTDLETGDEFKTSIRISAKDTAAVFTTAPTGTLGAGPGDSVDIDMSKIIASPEQTVRGFAIIKDALLVITPTATTLMKYGTYAEPATDGDPLPHDPQPLDTLNGFGSNAPRTIVEIGSDVFMVDFNGVPSAKLSTVSNAVVPERVSNYIETMMSAHIGRLSKETMRLKSFGFYDGKNKTVHFYLPKYDVNDVRRPIHDPFYFDRDMAANEYTKNTLIMRYDDHQLEQGDLLEIWDATGFSTIEENEINGIRKVAAVLNKNYILVEIANDLPALSSDIDASGGGNNIKFKPINDGSIGYIYHYVPQLKLYAWSRFKTDKYLRFNCGCGTIEGRVFLFTPDGFMMRYGSPDYHVHADWFGMYDEATWLSGHTYLALQRVFDSTDGLVYQCLQDVTTTAASFKDARAEVPEAWQEYQGEPINWAWELPWSDFGGRQATKSLRFIHIDANGDARFKLSLFADNIYKDAATGQLMPSRELMFVPNEAGAYGSGSQVYGAGRRTAEQKLWQMPVKCKLLKPRVTGATTTPLSISAISFMYQKGSLMRG